MAEQLRSAMLNAPSFIETAEILKHKVTTKISFWGVRKIYVEGYKGSFTFNDLWRRIDVLVDESESRNVTPDEIEQAKETWLMIKQVGKSIEKQEKTANCITRLFLLFIFLRAPSSQQNYDYWEAARSLKYRFNFT